MNFVFDNNLPPSLARAIAALTEVEGDVERVVHLTDLFPPATIDIEWIPGLSLHGTDWYVVSQDKFRKSRGAEREALRRAKHGAFVLDPSWSSQPFWPKCARLVEWWPRVLQQARLTSGGVVRVPWRFSPTKKFQSA